MGEIIQLDNTEVTTQNNDITSLTEELLLDVRKEPIPKDRTISMPIAQLSTLGAGVSSLIPAFNTITQTTTMNVDGLYRIANGSEGILKAAKNGNFWGALKTPTGSSKMAQLSAADPISTTNKMVMKANPAMLMMSVALFSIEKELGNIADMEKQILTFLQVEKESEIEADVITLNKIIQNYKNNWDNERYIASNHKMVLDLQRTARKNIITYKKNVTEVLNNKKLVVAKGQVNNMMLDLENKFKYYRLSLYTLSLSSLVEVMLGDNFKEEYINDTIDEIRKNSDEYRNLYSECSQFLEKLSNNSIEKNVLKGLGKASNAMGKFIGSIPKIKEGQVDEFLQETGGKLSSNASDISKDIIVSFAEVSDPNTRIFINKLEDMIQIYDKTSEICFDDKNIYLIA
ncbi:MAG: hypothetical protein K6F41_07375 [Lachnospira sp.]|nr:hypothetical protein [Lachnospira sp.]